LFLALDAMRQETLARIDGTNGALLARIDAVADDTAAIRQHLATLNGRVGRSEVAIGRLKLTAGVMGAIALAALGALFQFLPQMVLAAITAALR
jgi:hypothetical protein